MMLTFRPLTDYTIPTTPVIESRFLVTYSDVLDLLDKELTMLDADDPVVEVAATESDFRLDGGLRANARLSSPAVRLTFTSKHGPLTYASGRFQRVPGIHYVGRTSYDDTGRSTRKKREQMLDWQHNLYAIAKSLEALRMVDRYGVASSGEQYTGWKALPAGTPMGAGGGLSPGAAESIVLSYAGADGEWPTDTRDRKSMVRLAKANTHPDRWDGDRTRWDRVHAALTTLGLS